MNPPSAISGETSLLDARVTVPQHVVFRSFPSETVVLNLQTGKYHGLNPTAGQMLEALQGSDSIRDAAVVVAGAYGQERSTTEQDMCDLCRALLERGLVELDGNAAG